MNIKVSVIVPVYNVAPYLDACLSSCVNQTFFDMEIIVVDDGSTDESPLIIKKYAEKDDRVKVITKENQGLAYARKSGLETACGDYVFHLDGDDYIETNAIELLYDEAIKSGADYVASNYCSICIQNGEEKISNKSDVDSKLAGQDFLLSMIRNGKWVIWGKLMRKSLFDDIVYYPVSLGEDLFFQMQICLKVKKVTMISDCLYNYLVRPLSLTNQSLKKSKRLRLDMMKAILYLMDKYPYNEAIRDEIYMQFYWFSMNCMAQKDMEVKTILYDNYWSKKGQRVFLKRKRKIYYLITAVFLRFPFLGSLMARVYYSLCHTY